MNGDYHITYNDDSLIHYAHGVTYRPFDPIVIDIMLQVLSSITYDMYQSVNVLSNLRNHIITQLSYTLNDRNIDISIELSIKNLTIARVLVFNSVTKQRCFFDYTHRNADIDQITLNNLKW